MCAGTEHHLLPMVMAQMLQHMLLKSRFVCISIQIHVLVHCKAQCHDHYSGFKLNLRLNWLLRGEALLSGDNAENGENPVVL